MHKNSQSIRNYSWQRNTNTDESFLFSDEVNAFTRINRNFFKPPVSEEVKDMVRGNFTREIEFYQFCKQRLYKQLRALKLTKNTYETNSL